MTCLQRLLFLPKTCSMLISYPHVLLFLLFCTVKTSATSFFSKEEPLHCKYESLVSGPIGHVLLPRTLPSFNRYHCLQHWDTTSIADSEGPSASRHLRALWGSGCQDRGEGWWYMDLGDIPSLMLCCFQSILFTWLVGTQRWLVGPHLHHFTLTWPGALWTGLTPMALICCIITTL